MLLGEIRSRLNYLVEVGLGYIDSPASFEGYGQKIRTPDAIFAEGRGPCLDTTVLYAAALARASPAAPTRAT